MSFLDSLKTEFKKQPWYVWAGAAAGGGVVLFVLVKQHMAASASSAASNTTSSQTSQASNPLSGYDLSSMAGLPYGYEDGYPSGNPPPPPTTTIQQQLEGLIRAKETTGPYASYDKTHSGIPLRNAPGGTQLSLVPFGATVAVSGSAVTGPMNSQSGTDDWYPVTYGGQSGYVSSADLANIFQQQAQTGGGNIYTDIGLQPEHVGWV